METTSNRKNPYHAAGHRSVAGMELLWQQIEAGEFKGAALLAALRLLNQDRYHDEKMALAADKLAAQRLRDDRMNLHRARKLRQQAKKLHMDKKAARHKRKAHAQALEAKAPKPLPRINFVPVEPPGWMKALKEKTFRESQEREAAKNAAPPLDGLPAPDLPLPPSDLPPPPRRDPRSYPSPEEVQAQREAEADEIMRQVTFHQRQSAQEFRNGYI